MLLLLAAGATLATSCAWIVHGKNEDITVNSDPIGADVTLNNGMIGVTPFTISVPRQRDIAFHFSKPGYHPADIYVDTHVEGEYITGDFFSTLFTAIPVGWLSDVSTGSSNKHAQKTITAHLERDPTYVAQLITPTPSPSATSTQSSP